MQLLAFFKKCNHPQMALNKKHTENVVLSLLLMLCKRNFECVCSSAIRSIRFVHKLLDSYIGCIVNARAFMFVEMNKKFSFVIL